MEQKCGTMHELIILEIWENNIWRFVYAPEVVSWVA
ncbi:hypothetical protein ACP70R_037739 [Stipagrostis hirtigluma subsp. patula]